MRIGIYGYGNLGRGVEAGISRNPDMELAGIFTRRDPAAVKTLTGAPVYSASEVEKFASDVDVMIICGGSATDLPEMTPKLAGMFNVVDSFDTHARVPEHFEAVNAAAAASSHTAVISAGWDPGLFSLARLYMNCVLPEGKDYTFWGKGVSQGHSDAVRRVPGVKDCRQYTIPVPSALERVRAGEEPELTVREKHTRECFIVAEEGADRAAIEKTVKEMPNYFSDYDTTVHFITEEEMKRDHSGLPHGGRVIHSGKTGLDGQNRHVMEFSLKLDSNPEFTASVLLSCARAAARMNGKGEYGCKTMFDIPPAYLSPMAPEDIRRKLL